MYPAEIVLPMKKELTDVGFSELTTVEAVDNALNEKTGTALVVVNSVCGCAAGAARPGIKKALEISKKKPNHLYTVFAGFDTDGVAQARKYFLPYPPSSPAMALFKDGKLVHFIERHNIEGNSSAAIAEHLDAVFEEYC